MLRFSGRGFFFWGTVLFLCCAAGCVTPRQPVRQGPPDEPPSSPWLVSPELLKHARLSVVWTLALPLEKPETLDRLHIVGDHICAISDRNYAVCLDRDSGKFVFARNLARPNFGILGLELYDGSLISVIGNRLVEMDPQSGKELRSTRLEFGVTSPAARNRSYFYFACADRLLRAFRAEDKVKIFEMAADDKSMITSVVADDEFVVFATDTGGVICITPDKPKWLWRFKASDGIVGPIVRDEHALFFSSRDTYVYKLDVRSASVPLWKHQTGAMLDKAPRVTRQAVYQYVHNKGLTAIDKLSGRFMWQVEGGTELLGEAGDKAYVITKSGELVVMDNKKNQKLFSANFSAVSRYASNVADSKIYVGDKAGRVACLAPID